ncbi:MAG: adenylate kinase family protein [Candidatus Saccharibacteria bacterium]
MKLKTIIVLLGPPGSGKGTQADLLSQKTGFPHISTGELIREYIKTHPEEAAAVKERYDKGILQPDNFVLPLFEKKFDEVDQVSEGIISDAFPMSLPQAEFMGKILEKYGIANFRVLFIHVDEEEVVHRLSNRKICVGCRKASATEDSENYTVNQCQLCGGHMEVRSDDRPDVVRIRLKEYAQRTKELVGYYKEKGQLSEINGSQPVDAVQAEIIRTIGVQA